MRIIFQEFRGLIVKNYFDIGNYSTIYPREIWLILLSMKIYPFKVFVELFFHKTIRFSNPFMGERKGTLGTNELRKFLQVLQIKETFTFLHYVKSVQIPSSFWSVFSRTRTEHEAVWSIFPYSVQMQENKDQKLLRIWTLFTLCYIE